MAGLTEINNHAAPENNNSIEACTLLIPYITISGRSGTGKSHTADLLAQTLHIKPENNIKTGTIFRELLKQKGINVEGYAHREKEFDSMLDLRQKEYMLDATVDNPLILEGRLAGIINQEIKREAIKEDKRIPQGISFLFICDRIEREKRQIQRNQGKDPVEIIRMNLERDTRDFKFWQEIHPMLQGNTIQNLYDAKQNLEGKPMNPLYDIVIDTTNISVEEVVTNILNLLIDKGFAKRR